MKVLCVVVLTLSFAVCAWSQSKTKENLKIERDVATDCPSNQAILSAAHNTSTDNSFIFLISRLGKSENKQTLHSQRLNNAVRFYKTKWNRTENSIIVAIGKSVAGLGRIEVYANSGLVGFLVANKNNHLSLKCY